MASPNSPTINSLNASQMGKLIPEVQYIWDATANKFRAMSTADLASGGGGGGGAATIADGADVALGSTTDVAVFAPSGTATLISVSKAILAGVNNLDLGTPSGLGQNTMANSMPVTLASDQTYPLPLGAATNTTLATGFNALHADLIAALPSGANNIGSVRLTDIGGSGITSSYLAGKQRLDVNLAAGGVPAATAPSWADQIAGVDQSGNLRPLFTDTSGRLNVNAGQSGIWSVGVTGALPSGSALIGKVTLNDGTNNQTIKASGVASVYSDTAQVVVIRDIVETIQPLVLTPPTVNTLTAAGTVQAQIVAGGVYTFCISSTSTLGATANTLASCTTTAYTGANLAASLIVTYTGTSPSVGQLLAGAGITPGAYVVSVSAGVNFTMSLPATASGTVTLNVTAGSFAGTFQSSNDGLSWSNISVIPMTYAVNAAATSSFVAPGLFRYVSTQKDNYLRCNLTAVSSTGVLGNLSTGPTIRFNIDALDRAGGAVNLPYVSYVAATAATFPTGIPLVMPIDSSLLSEINLDVNTLTGTSQVVTTRGSNDDYGITFQGIPSTSITTITAVPVLTFTAAGSYRVAPGSKYFYAYFNTGTAVATEVIGGITARLGAQSSIQNAAITSGNITQWGGTNIVTGGVNGVLAIGGNVAHSAATTANPVPTGGRVVPITAATVDATLAAGDTSWTPISTGYQVIQKSFGTSELDWAGVNSLTPTIWASSATLTQVRAASGTANVRTYVSSLQVATDALGGATSLWLVDGAVAISSATVATPGVFTSGTHDFKIGDAIVLEGIASLAVTGVSANQIVYVVTAPSATTFTVALTPGGTGVQVTVTGTATAYRILKQVRLQTTALPVTNIPFPSPIRTAPNVALSLVASATQTGTIYADTQGYYGF